MSFDQDPNEQANISGADFAIMCDEMKTLRARIAELEAAAVPVTWSCSRCGSTSGSACNERGCFQNEAVPVQAIPEPTPMVYNCCGREVCDTANCPNSGPYYKVPKWRMAAYYYSFEPTGVAAVDRILSAVACAGKCFHSTENWTAKVGETYPYHTGVSPDDWIQNAANQAAAMLSAAPTPSSQSKVAESVTQDQVTWCGYVAGMIEQYLKDGGACANRETVISLIIQRRLKFLAPAAPIPQAEPQWEVKEGTESSWRDIMPGDFGMYQALCKKCPDRYQMRIKAAPSPQAEPPQLSMSMFASKADFDAAMAAHKGLPVVAWRTRLKKSMATGLPGEWSVFKDKPNYLSSEVLFDVEPLVVPTQPTQDVDSREAEQLPAGTPAQKVGGSYQAFGTIVSAFKTKGGEKRYVFEFDQPAGMLHIFGPSQVAAIQAKGGAA